MESAYDQKFEEMKKYIPFLENMIKRLEKTGSPSTPNPRQAQLDKIRSLRDLLLNKNKRMKMENLLKCEQVLVNLYAKVEQKETFAEPKLSTDSQAAVSREKAELESVRNKLKTAAKLQESNETLHEIARSNDVEFDYTGCKEPALFQRRPNKPSISPTQSVQKPTSATIIKSPQTHQKRNYTRVLVSPERSSRRWSTSEQTSSDKPLFSRRSPHKTNSPPPSAKKEKKRSKSSKSRKTNGLNITLNVPQESLSSLSTEDIVSRIINCKDGDVDIDTLRDLRTQILGELKQTGKNDDISDLILKSYNIKSNPSKKSKAQNSKLDVEEGELSDSESEAIESIYGSLPAMDKDKKSSTVVKTTANKDQQRKIQICLVIANKNDSNNTSKINEESQVVDLVSELEMCNENESHKSKDIILIDSDASSSPPKAPTTKITNDNSKTKRIENVTSLVEKANFEKVAECINIEDDNPVADNLHIEVPQKDKINDLPTETKENVYNSNIESTALPKSNETKDNEKSIENSKVQSEIHDKNKQQNIDQVQVVQQKPKFVANFYKPIDEHKTPVLSNTNNLPDKGQISENANLELALPFPVTSIVTNNLSQTQNSTIEKTNTITTTSNNEPTSVEKKKEDLQSIPLLNEPTEPPKVKRNVLSEIDILQALKNEILSGSIASPSAEEVTPALHKPKLVKVVNAQEVMPKRKISIEKYKEKVATSTTRPQIFKNRIKDDATKKQSLKLTDKECERFNLPKRLSLDDDDDDDDGNLDAISDDGFLAEHKDDSLGLDDIYGDLAPQSPDNETFPSASPPVIIPTDPTGFEAGDVSSKHITPVIFSDKNIFETNTVKNRSDVDMRASIPTSLQPQSIPQLVPPLIPPPLPPLGCGIVPGSPAYGFERNFTEFHVDSSKTVSDRISSLDPRRRRDINLPGTNSPNPYSVPNPERTPKSFAKVVAGAPNMTPSRMSNMTPSYTPSVPQLRTPNTRSFEMTPSHQTFELDEPIIRKHVYAPTFPVCESRERATSVPKEPYWDTNKCESRSRWEESNTHVRGPKWEGRDTRSNSIQSDSSFNPRYEDSYPKLFDNRLRGENYNSNDRRDSYNRSDCPATPIPSFGWSECPSTPSSAFGRRDGSMTPSHSFGRADGSSTPIHSFGRGDCPPTPSTGFGRNVDMLSNIPYARSECPPTPSHPFGRSECPRTPSHSFGRDDCPATPNYGFGRNECPRTPNHPFGRSESMSYNNRLDMSSNSNQKYSKDPRLNRRQAEYGSSPCTERNYDNQSERDYKKSSYKSRNKPSESDTPRNEREKSVGKNDRDNADRYTKRFDRNRRDGSLGPSSSRDVDNNGAHSKTRESRYDRRNKDYDDTSSGSHQRDKSVDRASHTKQPTERARSVTRCQSIGRNTDKELSKDRISFQSEAGKNFTINTSVKSTFLDFPPCSKPVQVIQHSSDRRKRAASVGRSLIREDSVGCTLTEPVKPYDKERKDRFKRASSVGREIVKSSRSLQEMKADFEAFKARNTTEKGESRKYSAVHTRREVKTDTETSGSKCIIYKPDTNKESNIRTTIQLGSHVRKDQDKSHQEQRRSQSKQSCSPRKNSRDPRMRKEHSTEIKTRYKIDRRGNSYENRKSGIIYSNDNIAKGRIMGSGFGVKNYKIPKIKRSEPEPRSEEQDMTVEKKDVKESPKETCNSLERIESKKNVKVSKDTEKSEVSSIIKKTSDANDKKSNQKCSEEVEKNSKVTEVSEVRVTRSKKKSDSNNPKDVIEDTIVKLRKSKKAIISDSESESEKEVTNKSSRDYDLKLGSPIKKNTKKINTESDDKVQKNITEESLESSFGIDDVEIFPENLESTSVINNINALIADLDNDLNTKISDDFDADTAIGNMMENINSPEGDSLADISEVIEKDLSKNKAESIAKPQNESITKPQNLVDDNSLDERSENITNIVINKSQNDTQPTISTDLLKDFPKINEPVVSTSEIGENTNEDKILTDVETITTNIGESVPDSSTANKSISSKSNDGLPDSTKEIHSELSSDVTSTYDTTGMSSKEPETTQSVTKKETVNSIENLLSILQDKSKIKELLAMLGDSSYENEKIKKKLEKFSEIVSDEEEEEVKKSTLDTTTEEKSNKEVINRTDDMNKHKPEQNKEIYNSDDKLSSPISENKVVYDPSNDDKLKNSNEQSITQEFNKIDDISDTVVKDADEENIVPKPMDTYKENDKTNKSGKQNQCDTEDDEPLMNKVTKKANTKKSKSKFKSVINKKTVKKTNKKNTATVPGKTGIKKKGELQKLQEDLKKFMSKDLLNPTGIRLCRLTKMVSEKESIDPEPVVVLEKVKEVYDIEKTVKLRKKPGPKPKNKSIDNKSPEREEKTTNKPTSKTVLTFKPGPMSKTKQKNDTVVDPYDFDTDSIADTSTTKESESDCSSDSEKNSLNSSHSFGSSEILAETKKKPKRKRRRAGGWISGIIKPKHKKKKEQKQDSSRTDSLIAKSLKPITIPDLNCFIDKLYCFQKSISTYDCRLCVYSGTDIVNHYKKQHPHTEIPLSRMEQKTAEMAIQQCEQENFQLLSKISSDKYTCRFCHKEFSGNRNVLETFFWHIVSNHTGEFKNECSECVNDTRCPFNLDIPPPPKDGGQLIGYICQKCNFTQISLENLKTHVHVRHNDEETEVFTINLSVMSNKAMYAMLRRVDAQNSRVQRTLRSNLSATDSNDIRDDQSDVSESSARNNESILSEPMTEDGDDQNVQMIERKPNDNMKAKLTFENDDLNDRRDDTDLELDPSSTSVKVEHNYRNDVTLLDDTGKGDNNDIFNYPHFKLKFTDTGAKEYVCCINGNDNHYKTSLLISMKKHIQSKHPENWDGYCSMCKVIVTLQGIKADFKDCLSHFIDKHSDDFLTVEKVAERTRAEIEMSSLPESNISTTLSEGGSHVTSSAPLPSGTLSPAIAARVATPPAERTASPSYIAVRPLSELISRELTATPPESQPTTILPKIGAIVSLGEETVPPAQPSPSYPTNTETISDPEKPFLYEEVQAEVMSLKHRVVLDVMMSKENLVRAFKCAGRFCSFTTDSANEALLHASTHQRIGGERTLNCAYCNYDACDNGIDLVMHVFKEHSRCQYCCPLCFYRAAASQLVGAHYARAHSGAAPLKSVLRSLASFPPPPPGQPTGLLTRDVAVQHFVCNHDAGACNFRTYTPGKFIEHLSQKHAVSTSHPCNLCGTEAPTPAELVAHLRAHGLRLYQCAWCVRGADTEPELLAHAAAAHPAAQPQAYVRVITTKEGGKRVLPLAYLNKSKMPAEDVTPNTIKENPVKEAERSIDLEKLIAHTMMMIEEASAVQEEPTSQNTLPEEPVEIHIDSLTEEHDNDVPTPLDSILNVTEKDETCENILEQKPAQNSNSLDASAEIPVKPEPAEVLRDVLSSDVICLDSDEEPEGTAVEPSVASNDETSSNEKDAQKISSAASMRNTLTDEVSITKVTDESASSEPEAKQSRNVTVESVIDLSDDDASSSTAQPSIAVDKSALYKCPVCLEDNKSAAALKKHVGKKCSDRIGTNLKCPHCTFVAINIQKLIMHYNTDHLGMPKNSRYYHCKFCTSKFLSVTGAKLHVRATHKVLNYKVAVTIEDGCEKYYITEADETPEPRTSGRKTSAEIQRYQAEPAARARKPSTELRKRYGVADVDKLPISPILDSQVFCDLCEFGTKVRLNMVRHLQAHAANAPVANIAPVNPVPHLQTNEMHFDRMVNLASSSAAARPEARAAADGARYPRFVAERLRYTCGARGCAYISVDMAMFRCHWETLHAAEADYRCVHCPPTQALTTHALTAARILGHLRMHDACLYACSGCSYYHYRRQIVEKHISELHKEATVKVVREESQPEAPVPAAPPAPAAGAGAAAPTMDLKPWQCGLCDFSSMLRPQVVTHCAADHLSKMQFKCGHCSYRSSAKENVVKHQANAHPALPEDVFYYFYKEGSIPDEDGVPCWQRQRKKLNLDECPVKTEVEPIPETPKTPISIPAGPAIAINLNIVKEEKPDEPGPGEELSIEELRIKFGEFCEPDGIKFKCCLCNVVREISRESMQSHLYEELNYRRWECVMCSYKAFHKSGLHEHMASEHSRQFTPPRALPVDADIERWVKNALDHQAKTIESNLANLSVQKIVTEKPPVLVSPKTPETPKLTNASDAELQNAFGEFGACKNQQFACPKCEFTAKDEAVMVTHLESELTKIRWGCTNCTLKYQTFHETQFHCKRVHTGQSARPKEAIRDPSLRAGWVKAVVASQKQFLKCISETNRESTPEKNTEDSDQNENSLLVALYDEPAQIDERPTKRSAANADSDDERLVIDEPPSKKSNDRKCPYCDYNIHNSRYIREHILKEHYNLKPYRCAYCDFEGTRQAVTNHVNISHSDLPKRIITVEVPNTLPGETLPKQDSDPKATKSKHDKDVETSALGPKASKSDSRDSEEVGRKICLYCEKSIPETETVNHTHGAEKTEFGKRGDLVVKCCKCLVLRLSISSLQEHFDACHPGENVMDNYAYFKLQVDHREIHCCGHCYKKFKFLRDLKVHHSTIHSSLSLSYTSIPFSHNLHTEGDAEVGKRRTEETGGPSAKRVALKSTSKPTSLVAKKSTTSTLSSKSLLTKTFSEDDEDLYESGYQKLS